MDLYDEARLILNESSATIKDFERASGVSYNTIKAIKRGEANPTYANLRAIIDCVRHKEVRGGDCISCANVITHAISDDLACELTGCQVCANDGCAMFKGR